MKKSILLVMLLLGAYVAKGQEVMNDHAVKSDLLVQTEVDNTEDSIYIKVEKMPEFVGGYNVLRYYLATNLKYPCEALMNKIEGRVVMQFIVEKDGSITNVRVARKLSPELDKEALRILKKMPNWNPGMKDGEPVRVKYTMPILFRLPKENPNNPKDNSRKRGSIKITKGE